MEKIEKDCRRMGSYSRNKYYKCIYKQWYGRNGKWNQNKIEKKVGIDINIEEKMGEKKVFGVLMFVMVYGLAVTRLSYGQIPATCNGDEKLLSYCGLYLINNVANPSSDCCNGASDAFKRAMAVPNGQGIRDICNCLRVAGSNLHFHPDKLVSLPTACHIQLSFSMDLCVSGPWFISLL